MSAELQLFNLRRLCLLSIREELIGAYRLWISSR